MSKKRKKILYSLTMALSTYLSSVPSTYARNFVPKKNSSTVSRTTRRVVHNYLEARCTQSKELSATLTQNLLAKGSTDSVIGKIILEPLTENHTPFVEKLMNCTDDSMKKYLKYFTREDELTKDKGKRYIEGHLRNMRIPNGAKLEDCEDTLDIFHMVKYCEFEKPVKLTELEKAKVKSENYVGIIGLTRAYGPEPALEVVIDKNYNRRGIASVALKGLIDFVEVYNFEVSNEANQVPFIKAVIADDNIGSITMATKNGFECVGPVPKESANNLVAKKYIRNVKTNRVLKFARDYGDQQKLINKSEDSFDEKNMVNGLDFFFNVPDDIEKAKNYESILKELENDIAKLEVPAKDAKAQDYQWYVKARLAFWPVAWKNKNGELSKALNISEIKSTLETLSKKNKAVKGLNYLDNPLSLEDFDQKFAF